MVLSTLDVELITAALFITAWQLFNIESALKPQYSQGKFAGRICR
jgi:hypothetical protein